MRSLTATQNYHTMVELQMREIVYTFGHKMPSKLQEGKFCSQGNELGGRCCFHLRRGHEGLDFFRTSGNGKLDMNGMQKGVFYKL